MNNAGWVGITALLIFLAEIVTLIHLHHIALVVWSVMQVMLILFALNATIVFLILIKDKDIARTVRKIVMGVKIYSAVILNVPNVITIAMF